MSSVSVGLGLSVYFCVVRMVIAVWHIVQSFMPVLQDPQNISQIKLKLHNNKSLQVFAKTTDSPYEKFFVTFLRTC